MIEGDKREVCAIELIVHEPIIVRRSRWKFAKQLQAIVGKGHEIAMIESEWVRETRYIGTSMPNYITIMGNGK